MLLSIAFSLLLQAEISSEILPSKILGEDRIVQIQLPDNYHRDSKTRYPVVYVLDGEYAFAYATGRVNFVSNGYGHLPQMIVVGIPNTDRGKDYYFGLEESMKTVPFLEFMAQELKPYIDRSLRTNGFDVLYGWSSASNINIVSLVNKPELFDAHILSGSGVGNAGKLYLEKNMPAAVANNTWLYASTESPGPRVSSLERFATVMNKLNPKELRYKIETIEGDHVGNIASGFDAGLQFVFGGFYIPEHDIEKGFTHILNYYESLNNQYQVDFDLPEGAIVEIVTILFAKKKHRDIEQLLEYGLKLYPESTDLYGTYGEVLSYQDNNEEAIKMYQKALQYSKTALDKLKYEAIIRNQQGH